MDTADRGRVKDSADELRKLIDEADKLIDKSRQDLRSIDQILEENQRAAVGRGRNSKT